MALISDIFRASRKFSKQRVGEHVSITGIDDVSLNHQSTHVAKSPLLRDKEGAPSENIVAVAAVKSIWIPIHLSHKVRLTGKIRRNLKSDSVAYELDDGTAKIAISTTANLNIDYGSIYEIIGTCKTDDGVYPYIEAIECKLINEIKKMVSISTVTHQEVISAAQSYDAATRKYDEAVKDESFRESTGANWRRKFEGAGVDSNSDWQNVRTKIFKRDNYRYISCGSKTNLTVDHIKPLGLGGTNAISNLRTLCAACHEERHGREFLDKNFISDDSYGKTNKVSRKVRIINNAICGHKKLHIKYTDTAGNSTDRIIRPTRIHEGWYEDDKLLARSCVYVDAYCELRADKRVFRLSRMSGVTIV